MGRPPSVKVQLFAGISRFIKRILKVQDLRFEDLEAHTWHEGGRGISSLRDIAGVFQARRI